ncbi:MAG: serine/threonine-protein kinase [Candidatus Levyibacteriota bacterium]
MLSNINGYKTKPEWFIDKGSFGSVYKAEKDGKFYAIKIFQSELLKTEYKSRLDREIKAIQKISHPNVVKLHDFGTFMENEFEYFYIVMDFIEGQSLTEYVGTVEEGKCIEIIESVLDTLDAVHKEGIIHRDLKPANIRVDQKGTPIILDFGLAKLIDYSAITQTGERVGTYYYMSPEQVTDSKNIDNRSDYFGIGVIFYELLTGKLPYDATNLPALIDQIKNQYPKNPSELNGSISNQTENVILKLLEKEPYQRIQNVSDIKNALKETPEEKKKMLDLSIRYFIRLLHTEKGVFEEALKEGLVDRVIFPANFFKFYHLTVKVLRSSGIPFTTDPATNRLTYTAFSKTAGVQALPYSSGNEVTPIQKKDFHSILQVQDYVKKVLDFQVENGVTELATPFFFAKNSSDEWFNINLKLIKESVAYRDQEYKNLPIWAGVCMNVENWHDDDEKNKILNYYVKTAPDGFFVYGDPIGNQSNLTQLFHYADLLMKLQTASSVPVVACRVNGFGLLLLSLGISGISSGISSLDNFRESILSDTQEGYSSDPRYYIPELMSMVTLKKGVTTKLTDIAKSSIGQYLKCSCQYCKAADTGSLTNRNMKLHFLTRRRNEITDIAKLDEHERITFIEKRVDTAISYSKTLASERIEVGDFSHLLIWRSLIQQFKKKPE